MNKNKRVWYFAGISLLLLYTGVLETLSPGDIRSIRDAQFQPALQSVNPKNGITQETLSKACGAATTPGISNYGNYFTEFYKPFVETFGGSPSAVCSDAAMGKITNVNAALKAAIPARGGSYTAQTIQSALKAIKDYITSGGSYLLFTLEWDDLITNLKVDTSTRTTNQPATTAASGVTGQDANVVAIAQALAHYDDTFLSADGSSVVDMPGFAAQVKLFNDPNDDRTNPKSAIGMIDQAINKYYKATGDLALYFNGYPFVTKTELDQNGTSVLVPSWGDTVLGMMRDLNNAYDRIDQYTATGANPIPSFEYDSNSESLDTLIPRLVSAVKANANSTTTSGSSSAVDITTDSNLKDVANALSGINGEKSKKDTYVTSDGKVDVNKLKDMATFATQLRSAIDLWQGDITDENSAAAPKLRYAENNFSTYKTAMNNAVADETDILNVLYGTDGTDGIFGQIGRMYSKTLTYDIDKTPSGNIFGDEIDQDGNTVMSSTSLVGVLSELIEEGSSGSGSTTYTLDNDETLKAFATMLSDQIAMHNAAVNVLAGRCGAMQKAFSDASDTVTTITLIDGRAVKVSGSIGGTTASTREVAQKVFKDVMDGDANNGMMTMFNNQAQVLKAHAQALMSAGIGTFATTDGEAIDSINYFNPKTVTVGNSNTSGKIDVKVLSYSLPTE